MNNTAWLSETMNKKDQTVRCLACSHYCQIKPGNRGICGVRRNVEGKLQLLVYGKPAAMNIDPIEKKPLYHFYPGMRIFSIGTVGCNFRCDFCQNWQMAQFPKRHFESDIKAAMQSEMSPQAIVDYCLENEIQAVAFTYNEPAIFFEYAYDIARLAKEKKLKTVYVSNGFETPEALKKIHPYLDAINIDLKSFDDQFYRKVCGGWLDPVKKNIRWCFEHGVWTEVTTLIIPNRNDSKSALQAMAAFLVQISSDIPWHLSGYYPAYKMDEPPTPKETLELAYDIGKKAGLKYVYLGNVRNKNKENTYCPSCQNLVIERQVYGIRNFLESHECQKCGEKIAGRFRTQEYSH